MDEPQKDNCKSDLKDGKVVFVLRPSDDFSDAHFAYLKLCCVHLRAESVSNTRDWG